MKKLQMFAIILILAMIVVPGLAMAATPYSWTTYKNTYKEMFGKRPGQCTHGPPIRQRIMNFWCSPCFVSLFLDGI